MLYNYIQMDRRTDRVRGQFLEPIEINLIIL